MMNSPSRPDDLSLISALDLIRYRLAMPIEAIIANRPFDAICAAARFWTVLEHVEHVVRALPDDRRHKQVLGIAMHARVLIKDHQRRSTLDDIRMTLVQAMAQPLTESSADERGKHWQSE